MPAGRTIGQQLPASARDTSRRLQALQTPRPRRPVHPARRVRRTRHTARHPGCSMSMPPRTIRPCRRCPQRPWLRGGRPPRAPRSAGQHRTAADAGVGGQNLFSSQAGSGTRPDHVQREKHLVRHLHRRVVQRPTSVQTQRASENARAGEARRKGCSMFASRGGCGSPSNCGASHGGRAAHLVEETAERLDYGCVREQSSDSEAAGPCELGQGCKPRGAVYACSFPVFAFFGAE